MSLSRRRFIKSGALGGLAAGLILKSNGFALGHDLNDASDRSAGFDYSRASFEPHVGSIFRLLQGEQTHNLTLVNLTDYQQARASRNSKAKRTESFVLSFRAPKNLSRSSTYRLEHPKLGTFDLFIARNGRRENMTAVVNRIV
jgi:hypothetical protein